MSSKSKRFTAAMVIRKIMIPPVMAAVFFTVLLFLKKGTFVFAADYIAAMIGIVIFPVLAYPVSLLAPALREKGREGQRNLAFIFSAAGYVLTFLYALQPGRSDAFRLITLIYVLSVAMLLFFNKLLHIRASGHSCSVSGPMIACLLFFGAKCLLPCLVLYGLSLWSSVVTRRHTAGEFLMGSFANLVASALAVILISLSQTLH